MGHILENNETHQREELHHLAQHLQDNNLVLDTGKTKEVMVDYRTSSAPLFIPGEVVERVDMPHLTLRSEGSPF